jgi:hypothetical protein
MPEGFGARLRKQREDRQIDLSWIAEETKIKRSLLEALERDDVSRWPSGIFRRAYVRTYAHIIGLDPDVVLREFLEVHPEPVDELEAAAAAASEEAARRNAAPGILLRTIVDSAIGSLARLRRPGATDGAVPAAPSRTAPTRTGLAEQPPAGPLRAPARTEVEPPFALQDSAAALEYVADLEDASGVADPCTLDCSPELEAASLLELQAASLVEEEAELDAAAAQEAAPDVRQPLFDVMLEPIDERVEQATASQPDQDHGAPAESPDERGTTVDPRLEAVATLCTELGRAVGRDRVLTLLEHSARALDATGLIVWLWADSADGLRPVLVHGYSEQVLAHLPTVRRDADNATAEAFRTASPCEVSPSAHATGALVVPLLIPEGCAGVLAVELQPVIEAPESVRALAILLAAALAQFVHRSRPLAGGRTRVSLRSQGQFLPDT